MRWRFLVLLSVLLAFFTAALGQDPDQSEQDRGFLTRFLEERFSGVGRDVRITGFAGALSSRATIGEMTVADAEGVWLTIRGAAISWNRSALLRGRVELGELTATEIEVARLPVREPEPGLPDPAAQAFQLPELPVSVQIDAVRAAAFRLGEPILGEEVTLTLDGSLRLGGGEGEANLSVERIDGEEGALDFVGAFSNETGILVLDLSLEEPQGGIAATALGLPGQPAITLDIDGTGPLSDFAADVRLSSDGEERLAGQVTLTREDEEAEPGELPPRRFSVDLGGDIAPLFLPQYRDFFGPRIHLVASGERSGDGQLLLEQLSLDAASISLDGNLVVGSDGLPDSFALAGRIAAPDGSPVRLPAGETPVVLDEASVSLAFDSSRGEDWSGTADVQGLVVGPNRIGQAELTAAGEISRSDEGAQRRRAAARVVLQAEEVALADPGLAEALGETVEARATLFWREGLPLTVSNLTLVTETARATFTGSLGDLAGGLPLRGQGSLNAETLEPFSTLAGRPLGGRVVLAFRGETTLLDQRFDLRATGVGRGLRIGIPAVDRIATGESRILVDARRDETGLTIREAELTAEGTRARVSGLLRAGASALDLSAELDDAGLVVPGLDGAATLGATVRETSPGLYNVTAEAGGPGGAAVGFDGTLRESAEGSLSADGVLEASIPQLGAFAAVTGRQIRGSAEARVTGRANFTEERYDVDLNLSGANLATGQATLDRLLGGRVALAAAVDQEAGVAQITGFELTTGEITASLGGRIGRSDGRIEGTARLRDIGLFAPDFPGPLDVTGTLTRAEAGRWGVDVAARGPGDTTVDVTGAIASDGSTVDLALRGAAPLGFANEALAPSALRGRAAFDLAMQGTPGLAALSGRVTTAGARLVAPTLGVAVDGISGTAALAGGRATVDLSGAVDGGGGIGLRGSVGLAAPNDAALEVALTGARLVDPELYDTTVSGTVTLSGPLRGGGSVGGALTLGPTEVRVAATGRGSGGEIEGLRHLNEPTAVRQTRVFAGFIDEGGPGSDTGGQRRPLALNLAISAPNQIFVRGRGLDAELGGSIFLGGTTAAIAPQGQFELIRGRLDILGRRFALDEGLARLEGSFDPYVRLVAVTEADEITVRIVLEGLVSEPDIRFESSPQLPEDEVLARLFFGRGLTELSPLQAAQLASAIATLAGRGGGGIVNNLRDNFGLDDLDITTGADGGAAVRAGRYISENVYTEITVGSAGQADISINLDVSRSVTVRGSVASDGETGLGIFYERDY